MNANPNPRPMSVTLEEAIPVIQAKMAEKEGVNSFKAKVYRRAGLGATSIHIATFEEVTIEHLANPEQWLPEIAGGSPVYVFGVSHSTENVPFVTYQIASLPGAPRDLDPEIVKRPTWKGPSVISYPGSKTVPTAATAIEDMQRLRTVLGTPAFDRAAVREADATTGGGSGASAKLFELERRMEAEKIERAIAEVQKKTDERFAELTSIVKTAVAAPQRPQTSIVEQIAAFTPVIAALGGILIPLLDANRKAATATETHRLEEAKAERERANKLHEDLMKALTSANDRASSGAADTMKIVGPLVEAVAAASRVTLQNVATMRELSTGEQSESEFVSVLKAGIAALGEWAAAKASVGPGAAPRQLPAGPRPQTPPSPADAAAEEQEIAAIRASKPEDIIQATVEAVQREHAIEEVVESFLVAMEANPGVNAEVQKAGGVLPLFRARLDAADAAWLAGHVPYVQKLIATFTSAMRAREASAAQPQQ